MKFLSLAEYNSLKHEQRVYELHLTPGLFRAIYSSGVTPEKIIDLIFQKTKTTDSTLVLHIADDSDLISKIEEAFSQLDNPLAKWYLMKTESNRAETAKRVAKIIPKGKIKTSTIDAALAQHQK